MADLDIVTERVEEIDLFRCLPADDTLGTSYDYFTRFPNFDEEVYYMLECATRENANVDELVKVCQEVVDARNKQMNERFENTRSNPHEVEISTDELLYDINESRDLLAEPICHEKDE
jgi:hypothetical protein